MEKWSLFRISDRKQFDNLSLATVDFFFRALNETTREDWLMWREGFADWRRFSELSDIFKHLENGMNDTPPPVSEAVLKNSVRAEEVDETEGDLSIKTPTASLEVETVSNRVIDAATSSLRMKAVGEKVFSAADEKTLSLMLESKAASEDRNHVRYSKKFRIRIFTDQGVLSVVTIDGSTSGFRLKDPLPPGLPRFFHVEVDLGPEGKIPLVCSEIREKDGRGSTRISIQVNDHAQQLKSALVRAA